MKKLFFITIITSIILVFFIACDGPQERPAELIEEFKPPIEKPYIIFDIEDLNQVPTDISGICNFKDELYFLSLRTSTYTYLWRSDAKNKTTALQWDYDFILGAVNFYVYNNAMYYNSSNGTWKYSGGPEPDPIPYVNFKNPIIYHGEYYFYTNYDSEYDTDFGYELYKWDFNSDPIFVADINPDGNSHISEFEVYQDKLYFSAHTEQNGFELWVYDPANGAKMVKDICPGEYSSNPSKLFVFKDDLYLNGYISSGDSRFLKYNKSDNEFTIINNANDEPFIVDEKPLLYDDILYYIGREGENAFFIDRTIFVFDGINPPHKIKAIEDAGLTGLHNLIMYKNQLFFFATSPDETDDIKLYKYSPANGLKLISNNDNNLKRLFQTYSPILICNDILCFVASTPETGNALWGYYEE